MCVCISGYWVAIEIFDVNPTVILSLLELARVFRRVIASHISNLDDILHFKLQVSCLPLLMYAPHVLTLSARKPNSILFTHTYVYIYGAIRSKN